MLNADLGGTGSAFEPPTVSNSRSCIEFTSSSVPLDCGKVCASLPGAELVFRYEICTFDVINVVQHSKNDFTYEFTHI